MVISVGNEQGPPSRVQAEATRLRELSVLKRAVDKTTLATPCQSGTPLGCWVNHLDLWRNGGGLDLCRVYSTLATRSQWLNMVYVLRHAHVQCNVHGVTTTGK